MLAEIVWTEDALVVASIFGAPVLIVAVLAWVHLEQHRSDNELKRDMIQRGMSVEEMERVLKIKPAKK